MKSTQNSIRVVPIARHTLPENYDDFEFYRYIFRDTMSHGLELVGEYEVGTDGYDKRNIVSGITVKVEQGDGETINLTQYANADDTGMFINIAFEKDTNKEPKGSLTIQFDDLRELERRIGNGFKFKPNAKFIITYSAKVTQFATTGNDGDREQSNRVFLEYTRNPNDTSDPNDVKPTLEDVVEIYIFELDVAKVDSENNTKKLPGAKFVLYRKNGDTNEYVQLGRKLGDSIFGDDRQIADIESKVKGWTEDEKSATVLVSDATGAIKVIGLDSGTYYLEEIEAPAGYNKLTKPVTVEIISKLDQSETHPDLESVKIKIDGKDAQDGSFTAGTVSTDIANARGTLLPSTGGSGTTLFYVAGMVLVAGAAAVMIFKRRKSA